MGYLSDFRAQRALCYQIPKADRTVFRRSLRQKQRMKSVIFRGQPCATPETEDVPFIPSLFFEKASSLVIARSVRTPVVASCPMQNALCIVFKRHCRGGYQPPAGDQWSRLAQPRKMSVGAAIGRPISKAFLYTREPPSVPLAKGGGAASAVTGDSP